MLKIYYRGGYKYQLAKDYVYQSSFAPELEIFSEFIAFLPNGLLNIKRGYAWDGTSGPTIDGKTNMRASLVHDAFYQLIREGHLSFDMRDKCDQEFRRVCLEDGMWSVRAWVDYQGLKLFGASSCTPGDVKEVMSAP